MFFVNLGLGFFLILIGFLVKKYPELLAGYNTMSESEKQAIDINKVSSLARNGLILTGATVIDSSVIMYFLKSSEEQQALVVAGIILLGVIILSILANKVPKLKP